MHFLLFYDVVDDYVARRAPFRAAHVAYARQAVARGARARRRIRESTGWRGPALPRIVAGRGGNVCRQRPVRDQRSRPAVARPRMDDGGGTGRGSVAAGDAVGTRYASPLRKRNGSRRHLTSCRDVEPRCACGTTAPRVDRPAARHRDGHHGARPHARLRARRRVPYAFGAVYDLDAGRRRRVLVATGAAMTAAFVMLRALNLYGDPRPWEPQSSGLFTLLSFINVTKYASLTCPALPVMRSSLPRNTETPRHRGILLGLVSVPLCLGVPWRRKAV